MLRRTPLKRYSQMINRWFLFAVVMLTLNGCATELYPIQMLETEVHQRLKETNALVPDVKMSQAYSSKSVRLTFEKVDEDNLIYGNYVNKKDGSQGKLFGLYDGNHLKLVWGRDGFFLQNPKAIELNPDKSHWSWGAIDLYEITPKKLVLVGKIRKCPYDSPQIRQWNNSPWSSGGVDCRYKREGSYDIIYSSTSSQKLQFPQEILASEQAAKKSAAAKAERRKQLEEREAKLPISVRRDKFMISLSKFLKAGDYDSALDVFPRLEALDIAKDPSLDFFYGEALLNTGKPSEALEKLYRYVSDQGSGAKHYTKALELINTAESQL